MLVKKRRGRQPPFGSRQPRAVFLLFVVFSQHRELKFIELLHILHREQLRRNLAVDLQRRIAIGRF